jgi:thiamine kinase-like enzyme
MRISLLQQREPFSKIVTETLAAFWTDIHGKDISVEWHDKPPRGTDRQIWHCNPYLNAIFVRNVKPQVLQPIRQEFSRSLVRWRRPLQKSYVALSTNYFFSPLFANGCISVEPSIPDAANKLVVPGNNKIRILDYSLNCATGIQKVGFLKKFIRSEIETRKAASAAGVRIPKLLQEAPDASWFREAFFCGTPINRLQDISEQQELVADASQQLQHLHLQSVKSQDLNEYSHSLELEIEELVQSNHLLTHPYRAIITLSLEIIRSTIASSPNSKVNTCLSHGDFQDANIMESNNEAWVIDWEYSDRRQVGYDELVYNLQARSSHQSTMAKLLNWVESENHDAQPAFENGINRNLTAMLFILEELKLALQENAAPCFQQLGSRLLTWIKELEQWQNANPANPA